jgi:signal transduction histidine kinase
LFNSLISRVILLNVLLLIVGVGAFAIYHMQRERGHLIDVHRQSAKLLLDTIERSIFHSMSTGNLTNVQSTLEKVGKSDELVGVYIFDEKGSILRSALPALIGQTVPKDVFELYRKQETEGFYDRSDGTRILTVQQTIKADERCVTCHGTDTDLIGVLSLDFSLARMTRQLRETSTIFVHSTLVNLIALTVGITLILTRMLRRPLEKISRGMAQVEAGDLSVRMPERVNDEVGRLMHGFNSMVSNLDQTQQELQQIHYQQMERADRLASIGEMAAGLAHEIKNPLAGIGGAIDVLADDYPEEDPRREVMTQIQKQVTRMNKTVTDLLNFGRPGEPEFSYVDINSLVKHTQLFASQHPEAKNVNWIEELTRNLPYAWGDKKQIQQVLLNVMINGLQAMRDGGVLTILTDTLSRDGRDWIRVDIRDTGPGISADEIKNIFTPFYTSKTQGTGLGLPICRQLMAVNGGKLRVDNQLGHGACFTLELPVAENQDETLKLDE